MGNRMLDGSIKLVDFVEHDGSPAGRVVLSADDGPDGGVLGLHVYECEATREQVGIASVDLDLEHAEILLRHLDGWVRRQRSKELKRNVSSSSSEEK